jgi:hypothetical protein
MFVLPQMDETTQVAAELEAGPKPVAPLPQDDGSGGEIAHASALDAVRRRRASLTAAAIPERMRCVGWPTLLAPRPDCSQTSLMLWRMGGSYFCLWILLNLSFSIGVRSRGSPMTLNTTAIRGIQNDQGTCFSAQKPQLRDFSLQVHETEEPRASSLHGLLDPDHFHTFQRNLREELATATNDSEVSGSFEILLTRLFPFSTQRTAGT